MKLIIDRQRWYRGQGDRNSRLKRKEDGKMCCLGFLALECGYSKKEIEDRDTPENLIFDIERNSFPAQFTYLCNNYIFNSLLTLYLTDTNDNMFLDEETRELLIKKDFAVAGIGVKFINE